MKPKVNLFITKFIMFLVVFGLSFLLSEMLVRTVFVSYRPEIRRNMREYMVFRFTQLKDLLQKKDTVITESQLQEFADYTAPGVKASETKGTGFSEYELNNISWEKHTITLKDGTTVTIEVPKGQSPPDASVFEPAPTSDSIQEVD